MITHSLIVKGWVTISTSIRSLLLLFFCLCPVISYIPGFWFSDDVITCFCYAVWSCLPQARVDSLTVIAIILSFPCLRPPSSVKYQFVVVLSLQFGGYACRWTLNQHGIILSGLNTKIKCIWSPEFLSDYSTKLRENRRWKQDGRIDFAPYSMSVKVAVQSMTEIVAVNIFILFM